MREQRSRLASRLLPALAVMALATGAAGMADAWGRSSGSRSVSLAAGLTATALAALALSTARAWRNLAALVGISAAAMGIVALGWGAVAAATGGAASPYALAAPFSLELLVAVLPLPPWLPPAAAAGGAVVVAISAPGAPLAFLVLGLTGAGGWSLARERRRRALVDFRRLARIAAALARMKRVQEQLVVVEKLEALRVLVGGIAHELNNALAISVASAEQAASVAERDPAAAAKAAQRAQAGLLRIRHTIDRLRRFAMADDAVLEPADVCAMLDFALDSAIGRARSGVIVERDYASDVAPVECHVAALAEALYQIAKNAVESMPKGGTVRASVREAGGRVVLAVADEGQGIPPERLARVFDPFFARDGADTLSRGRILPPTPGRSGLGLSAVYGIVRALGGEVEIRSEVGKGTEVAVSLPARRSR